MDDKFLIKTEDFEINSIQITNDNLVNEFLNKNISLESVIEEQIYKGEFKC